MEYFSPFLHKELSVPVADTQFTCILDTGFFYPDRIPYEPHMHMEYEVHLAINEPLQIELSDSDCIVTLPCGYAYIIPPFCYHNIVQNEMQSQLLKQTFRLKISKIPQDIGIKTAEPYASCCKLFQRSAQCKDHTGLLYYPEAAGLFEHIRCELSLEHTGSQDMAESYMRIFLVGLIRVLEGSEETMWKEDLQNNHLLNTYPLSKTDSRSARETKILLFMDNSYMEPITEAQLASHLNLSTRQTSRLFTEYFGMTFKEKLTEVRLNHACKLLSRTNLSTEEIAYRVGYNAPSAFFVAFRRYFHMTPISWRKSK